MKKVTSYFFSVTTKALDVVAKADASCPHKMVFLKRKKAYQARLFPLQDLA